MSIKMRFAFSQYGWLISALLLLLGSSFHVWWWFALIWPIPLWAYAWRYNITVLEAVAWYAIATAGHYGGIGVGLYRLACGSWHTRLLVPILAWLYYLVITLIWLLAPSIHPASPKGLRRALRMSGLGLASWAFATWLYIIFVCDYSLIICGIAKGYPLFSPLIALAECPMLLWPLPFIGERLFLLLLLGMQAMCATPLALSVFRGKAEKNVSNGCGVKNKKNIRDILNEKKSYFSPHPFDTKLLRNFTPTDVKTMADAAGRLPDEALREVWERAGARIAATLGLLIIWFAGAWVIGVKPDENERSWASLGVITSQFFEHDRHRTLSHIVCHVHDLQKQHATMTCAVFPESSVYGENIFPEGGELGVAHDGYPGSMVIGGFRRCGDRVYNTVWFIHHARVVDYFDKQELLPITEYIPWWGRVCGTGRQFFTSISELACSPVSQQRPLWEIAPGLRVVPYICSELFLAHEPLDAHRDVPILALCNTAWVPQITASLMLRAAVLRALAWQRTIIYIAHTGSYLITKQGMRYKLVEESKACRRK